MPPKQCAPRPPGEQLRQGSVRPTARGPLIAAGGWTEVAQVPRGVRRGQSPGLPSGSPSLAPWTARAPGPGAARPGHGAGRGRCASTAPSRARAGGRALRGGATPPCLAGPCPQAEAPPSRDRAARESANKAQVAARPSPRLSHQQQGWGKPIISEVSALLPRPPSLLILQSGARPGSSFWHFFFFLTG